MLRLVLQEEALAVMQTVPVLELKTVLTKNWTMILSLRLEVQEHELAHLHLLILVLLQVELRIFQEQVCTLTHGYAEE